MAAVAAALFAAAPTRAEMSAEELAKLAQISAYYNVAKPDFGPNWQIRAQVQLMFPE